MRTPKAVFFALSFLYVTGAAAVEYEGFCTIESRAAGASTRGCHIQATRTLSPVEAQTFRIGFDKGGPVVIRLAGDSCNIAGRQCVEQPSTFPGNLLFVDSEGSSINFPTPPSE